MIALSDYYSKLKRTLNELNFYQLFVLDLKVFQWYRDELPVVKFLSDLDISLGKFKNRFLEVIPFLLSPTLSRVHFVSMRGDSSSSVSSLLW